MTETLTPRVRIDTAKELAFDILTNGNPSAWLTADLLEHLTQVAIYTGSENYEIADWYLNLIEAMHSAAIS